MYVMGLYFPVLLFWHCVGLKHPSADLCSTAACLFLEKGSFHLSCGVYCLHLDWDFQCTLGALTIIIEV